MEERIFNCDGIRIKVEGLIPINLGSKINVGKRYMVSLDGRVFSRAKGELRELKAHPDGRRGYLKVKLYLPETKISPTVHRLLLESYTRNLLGKAADRMDLSIYTVDHVDMNILNNDINNLRWMSVAENLGRKLTNHWNWPTEEKETIFSLYYKDKKSLHDVRTIMKRDAYAVSQLLKSDEAKKWCEDNGLPFIFRNKNKNEWIEEEEQTFGKTTHEFLTTLS